MEKRTSRSDVFVGMAFSNIVMFAIILATAHTLHAHGVTNVQSAAEAETSHLRATSPAVTGLRELDLFGTTTWSDVASASFELARRRSYCV